MASRPCLLADDRIDHVANSPLSNQQCFLVAVGSNEEQERLELMSTASQPFKRARSPSKQSGVLQGLSLNLFRAGVVAGPIF